MLLTKQMKNSNIQINLIEKWRKNELLLIISF